MMLAHIIGIPIEETVLQLAPAGAAIVTVVVIAGRTTLGRLRRPLRHRAGA
jgi:protein required for attachment to host cells